MFKRIVPWNEWTAMIKPCYYKGERGNKPYDLELMLRLYLIQNLYNLADEATVAEVTDGLTGTPASNGLMDLFAEFKLLDTGERLGRFIVQRSVSKKHIGANIILSHSLLS